MDWFNVSWLGFLLKVASRSRPGCSKGNLDLRNKDYGSLHIEIMYTVIFPQIRGRLKELSLLILLLLLHHLE